MTLQTQAAPDSDAQRTSGATAETPSNRPTEDRLFGRVFTFASLASVLLLMARVTKHAADPLDNSDTWFHLRLGHEFLSGWSLRHPGQLSSFATSPWVPTQWSTEILAAKMNDWFGLPGVAWLFGLLYLVLIASVFFLCRRHGDLLPAAVATGVCVVASGASLSARPQVVSLVLFTLTVAAWNRTARTATAPWWLVPLTWLWATAHGMWTAGVLVGVATAIGVAVDQRLDWRATGRLLAVPALSVVAACLTPVGPALLTSQLAVGERTSMITEWGPTSFREPAPFLVALMVGVTVLRWARRGSVAWTALFQLVLAGGWVLLVSRMVPFGAILAGPLFVAAVTEVVPRRARSAVGVRAERLVVLVGAALCLVGLALAVPHTAAEPGGVPTQLGARLERLPAGSAVVVEDGSGAWLEYAFPDLNPTIDGMLDAYPVSYMRKFREMRDVEPGWISSVRDSGARVAVLREKSPLSMAMEAQLHWRVVQKDRDWVYLEAPSI